MRCAGLFFEVHSSFMTNRTTGQLREYLLLDETKIRRRREFFGSDDHACPLICTLDGLFSADGLILADDSDDHLLHQPELRYLIGSAAMYAAKGSGRQDAHLLTFEEHEAGAPGSKAPQTRGQEYSQAHGIHIQK
jgi:hypothetical protein